MQFIKFVNKFQKNVMTNIVIGMDKRTPKMTFECKDVKFMYRISFVGQNVMGNNNLLEPKSYW